MLWCFTTLHACVGLSNASVWCTNVLCNFQSHGTYTNTRCTVHSIILCYALQRVLCFVFAYYSDWPFVFLSADSCPVAPIQALKRSSPPARLRLSRRSEEISTLSSPSPAKRVTTKQNRKSTPRTIFHCKSILPSVTSCNAFLYVCQTIVVARLVFF